MSNPHDRARLNRIKREIEATKAYTLKHITRLPPLKTHEHAKGVHFPTDQLLEQIKEISPRTKNIANVDHIDRRFQETLNRLILHWIKSRGGDFQKRWMKQHPRLPHVTEQGYEETLEQAMDREANKYAHQKIEQLKLVELTELAIKV